MSIFEQTQWRLDNECNVTISSTIQFDEFNYIYNLTDSVSQEAIRWEGRWNLCDDDDDDVRAFRTMAGCTDKVGNGQYICFKVVRLFVKPPGEKAFHLRYPMSLENLRKDASSLGDLQHREMWLKLRPLQYADGDEKGDDNETKMDAEPVSLDKPNRKDISSQQESFTRMCSCRDAKTKFWCVEHKVLHCNGCKCEPEDLDALINLKPDGANEIIMDAYCCRDISIDPGQYYIAVEDFQKQWNLLRTATFIKRF